MLCMIWLCQLIQIQLVPNFPLAQLSFGHTGTYFSSSMSKLFPTSRPSQTWLCLSGISAAILPCPIAFLPVKSSSSSQSQLGCLFLQEVFLGPFIFRYQYVLTCAGQGTFLLPQHPLPPPPQHLLQTHIRKKGPWGLPWWRSGWDSTLPRQGARVRSLVRELDSTHMPQLRSQRAATEEPACQN